MNIRWKLKLLSFFYKITCRYKKIMAGIFILSAFIVFFKGQDLPSYRKEYFMDACAVALLFLSVFIYFFAPSILYTLFHQTLKENEQIYMHTVRQNENKYYEAGSRESTGQKDEQKQKSYVKNNNRNTYSNNEQDFFAGVKEPADIKKRYRELLKIYHPDTGTGDNTLVSIISRQYREKLQSLNKAE